MLYILTVSCITYHLLSSNNNLNVNAEGYIITTYFICFYCLYFYLLEFLKVGHTCVSTTQTWQKCYFSLWRCTKLWDLFTFHCLNKANFMGLIRLIGPYNLPEPCLAPSSKYHLNEASIPSIPNSAHPTNTTFGLSLWKWDQDAGKKRWRHYFSCQKICRHEQGKVTYMCRDCLQKK